MTTYQSRFIAVAAVLIVISSLVRSTHVHAEQPPDTLSLGELRALAEQGDGAAQVALGLNTSMARVCRRTERRRFGGFVWRPTRVTRAGSRSLGACTTLA